VESWMLMPHFRAPSDPCRVPHAVTVRPWSLPTLPSIANSSRLTVDPRTMCTSPIGGQENAKQSPTTKAKTSQSLSLTIPLPRGLYHVATVKSSLSVLKATDRREKSLSWPRLERGSTTPAAGPKALFNDGALLFVGLAPEAA
jgi:hypothetical protein